MGSPELYAQVGPVMAPWLALTTDGMLLAALVVIRVRRHRREPAKAALPLIQIRT